MACKYDLTGVFKRLSAIIQLHATNHIFEPPLQSSISSMAIMQRRQVLKLLVYFMMVQSDHLRYGETVLELANKT